PAPVERVHATLPLRVTSERGRTEFMMVSLARRDDGALAAYPIAKGSGSVTAFSQADGFIAIDAHAESLAAGTEGEGQLIGGAHPRAGPVRIRTHCVRGAVPARPRRAGGRCGVPRC